MLDTYNLSSLLKQRGEMLIGPCPIHGGDNLTAFRVNLTRGIWNCFTACGGGDTVDLLCQIEKCSKTVAAKILRRMIKTSAIPKSAEVESNHHVTAKNLFRPFRRTIPLNPTAPFLQQNKAITVETAKRFEAGLPDPKSSFLQGTIAVRLHDMQGHPLGYCGRRLHPETIFTWGKWRFPKNFPKGKMLYNAHRALAARHRGLVLVECPWAAMRLTQAGISSVVALLGTTLTQNQLDWIRQAPAVVLLLDGDQAGRSAARKIARLLKPHTSIIIHNLLPDQEPEDLSDQDLAATLGILVPFLLNPLPS